MANLTITNIDQLDGARGVETSEQALLKLAGADTILRLTSLVRLVVELYTPTTFPLELIATVSLPDSRMNPNTLPSLFLIVFIYLKHNLPQI